MDILIFGKLFHQKQVNVLCKINKEKVFANFAISDTVNCKVM